MNEYLHVAWLLFSDLLNQFHTGFDQLGGLCEPSSRRFKRYHEAYIPVTRIKRTDFHINSKADIHKLRRIKRICEDALDLPITEDSDVRAALLLAPQEFVRLCREAGLLEDTTPAPAGQ